MLLNHFILKLYQSNFMDKDSYITVYIVILEHYLFKQPFWIREKKSEQYENLKILFLEEF